MGVNYRLLGRLEVERDGVPVELGAFRQRALLGLLLANAGTVLSTDRILDELWGPSGGIDKQGSLWVYVSGLRGVLEPERAKRTEGTVLLTRAPGYVLAIDRDDTDVGRFERLTAEARLLVETDPVGASSMLSTALAMWRGHAYEEFAYESWAQGEIARLDELRLEAVEQRVEADLRRGQSRQLVSELQSLARQHPLRERFVLSLMLALYRSGRAAEALRASASFRERLVAEIGIEPSRMMRDLEHQILVDDADLLVDVDRTGGRQRPRSGLTVRGYELREELGRGVFGTVFRAYQPIVGREVAIKVITSELADDPEFIRRFDAEAQLVAGLEHPHIVPLYDYWREPGAAYLVMRLVETGTLADALVGGALPADRAATVFAQVAAALHWAHRRGVVHRDVKPANILIDGDGNAYLTDFGVAVAPATGGRTGSSLTVPYAAPEQLAHQPVSAATDVYSLAVVAATALTGLDGEYEQVRGALTPAVRTVLDRATATDPARRDADAAAFGRALTDALGAPGTTLPPETAIENPYKGLRAFGAADSGDFFGRERLIERLILRLGEAGTRGRFVAVVGPSGSGKSSVVRAGLLPALASGALAMSADWFRIDMTPAPHPFEELEAALVRVAREAPNTLLDLLITPGGVRRAISRVLPDDHSQLLLVIDQFEELFTQVDDATANRFIDELVDVVTAPGTRVRVVITLRADFYDRPLRHRGLGELLRDGTEVITPMSIEELDAAITGPAGKVGVDIEPLVVSEMVGEIADRPGALPLLQYTMTELFEARAGRTITIAAYRAGGGVSRTLARRADSLLAGLGPEATETARHVLLRLVNLSDDGSGSGTETRRRALVAEVEELGERVQVQRVLDTFGRHRLLSFDRDPVTRGPTVEISHEALLTEWTTLRGWVDDARDDLRVHRHLVGEMDAWTAAQRSPDYLLRGERLDAIAAWASSTTMGLRPAEHEFLDVSLAARAEHQRVRDEEAKRRSDAEHRARRRTRQLVVAALVLAMVAGLASFAWVQREDARQAEEYLATNLAGQRLADLSVKTLPTDPELALLLAEQAVSATADSGYALPEAIDAMHWALQDLGVQYAVTADTPTAARFGPSGVRGVWVLPVEELLSMADAATTRTLSVEECRRYVGPSGCAASAAGAVQYLDGTAAYADVATLDQAEVVIAVPDNPDPAGEIQRNLDAIAEKHGLRLRLQRIPFASTREAAAQRREADVYVLAGLPLAELAASRPLLDLRAFIDETQLLDDYGSYLVSLSRVGSDGTSPSDTGPVYAVPFGAESKALVWTKEPEFTGAGYPAPTDWASFMALADTMVADGRTPFCLGIESGSFDGWPASDWVEMVVLRTAGPDVYDAWARHDVPFDDPAVVAAIRTIGEMVHRPGVLDTSPEQAAVRSFEAALLDFASQPESCLMTPFSSSLPASIGSQVELSVGNFPFPTFGTGNDDAVVGGAGFAVAVTDRPEVRAFMAALASPDWGIGSAELEWPATVPANARFDVGTIANPEMGEIAAGVQAAIRSDDFRFDASDAMPPEVWAAFYAGMVRLFREGSPDNLDALSLEIARDVEAVWTELEATAD